ncbi:MAG: hypothetical protein ACRDBX_01880 [Erysipelotrichaceae bacterium]
MMYAFVAAGLLFAVALLYALIALGYPYGEYAMGGVYKIVPKKKRAIYGYSMVVQLLAILIVLQCASLVPLLFSYEITKGLGFLFVTIFTVNILTNAISKSKKERYLMTPVSIVIALCYWIIVMAM